MKVLITSDLHIDINGTNEFGFIDKINDVDLTIIAGDISGSYRDELKFLNSIPYHESPLIAIGGNHLGYEFKKDSLAYTVPILGTKDYGINELRKQSKYIDNTYYFENEYTIINNHVVFGGIMYTDFNLCGKKYNKSCKSIANRWMNDFNYVRVKGEDDSIKFLQGTRCITPEDYHKRFKKFKRKLKECLVNTEGNIIVITHFAPSKKSISEYYGHKGRPTFHDPGFPLNAAYASNLEKFILKNERIKLWVHGHMHDSFDYTIGQCRVVCFPYGYKFDTTVKPIDYNGKVIEV